MTHRTRGKAAHGPAAWTRQAPGCALQNTQDAALMATHHPAQVAELSCKLVPGPFAAILPHDPLSWAKPTAPRAQSGCHSL